MKYISILSLTLFLAACQPAAPTQDAATAEMADTTTAPVPATLLEHPIVPGERIGPVTVGITLDELTQTVGADHIMASEFYIGEGYSEPGLVLYEDSPKEMEIHLRNDSLSLVRIDKDNSVYKTAEGLGVGSSLAALTAANGGPFELMGFGWDYGGVVTNWKDGKLGENFMVRLTLEGMGDQRPDDELNSVMGDVVISSDLPILSKYTVKVIEISQALD